jgi:hypothetical protein
VAPVYASSDSSNSQAPVGALLFGDILNGKAFTVDMVQDEFSDCGFTGVAAYNASAGIIAPLAGVFAPSTQRQQYSYDVQGNYASALQEAYAHKESELWESKIGGEDLKYYIKQADLSYRLDAEDNEVLLPEYYPPVILIRGTSISQWDSFKKNNLALSLSMVIVELCFIIVMFIMLYQPIHKFAACMDSQAPREGDKSSGVMTKVTKVFQGFGHSRNKDSAHHNTRTENSQQVA